MLLALPVLGLRLGFSDESNFAEDTTTRQAYDLLVDGFGPGFNGPFLLAAQVDGPADPAVLAGHHRRGRGRPGRRRSSRRRSPNDPDETLGAYLWKVIIPTTSPQDEATTSLVHRLRDEVLVDGEAALGTEVAVTGQLPATVDFSGYLSARGCRTSSRPCWSCRSCC